jgi:hypothetical protein
LHEMGSLEADHDGSLARVVSPWISGTEHTRNGAPRKICDRTVKYRKSQARSIRKPTSKH